MAYLITTTGNRIPLRAGNGYVLGRGRDCDVVLDDIACSRRHALLGLDETGLQVTIEDLDSRNGTFLNGKAVTERTPLRNGHRIRVGASVLLVQLLDADQEIGPGDTGTMTYSRPSSGADIDGGELAEYGLLELLKLLMHSRRNLSLHVALADDDAQIELRDGEVLAAACGGLTGFNALVKLARAQSGIFWVVNCDDEVDRNVQEHGGNLLVELGRCLGMPAP